MKTMTTRYRLIYRAARSGTFYAVDKSAGKRTSLQTGDKAEAISAPSSWCSPRPLSQFTTIERVIGA